MQGLWIKIKNSKKNDSEYRFAARLRLFCYEYVKNECFSIKFGNVPVDHVQFALANKTNTFQKYFKSLLH